MHLTKAIESTPTSKSDTPSSKLPFRLSPSAFASRTPRAPVPKGVASRAALAADIAGYEASKISGIHVIAQYVPQALWHKELLKVGFQEDDIDTILHAMMEDMS
jgi:hypothetical protein